MRVAMLGPFRLHSADGKQGAQAHRHLAEAEEAASDMSRTGPAQVVTAMAAAPVLLDENEHEAARERLVLALDSGMGVREMPAVAAIAEIAARWRLRIGDPLGAERMLGLAVRLRGVPDEGDPDVRGVLAELAAHPDPETRRKAFDAGAALSREEAFDELRATLA
ncbi:hypothetical protein [Saccharopolyspora sp. SCSIO 74807]|uniref:hypothetical protein n=1 Tax=Saccharopolyspora sp. SCSIO 74807 TaxID=3118084 RepID=UPI0030D60642